MVSNNPFFPRSAAPTWWHGEGRAARETHALDAALSRDLSTLALFISVYCTNKHPGVLKAPVELKTHDVAAITGSAPLLCPSCSKLLAHAFVKRSTCPLDPKPSCKHCPQHCYHPAYRRRIQEVMRYSGRRLVLTGRLDLLAQLLF